MEINREGYIMALRNGGWPQAHIAMLEAMTETEWQAFLVITARQSVAAS